MITANYLAAFQEQYGPDVVKAALAAAPSQDFESVYAAIEKIVVKNARPQLDSLRAVRKQNCTSSVVRPDPDRQIDASEIELLGKTRRKFRV